MPYAFLSMPVEEPVTLHLDLERGQWSQEEFPVAGGTLSIEDCAPLESKLEELGQGEGDRYWSLKLRYHPAEDLTLTSCRLSVSPEMELENIVVDEILVDGEVTPAALERGFGICGMSFPEDNLVELTLDGWDGFYDPSNVILEVYGALSLRWNHSFDLPLLVEPKN